MRQLYFGKKLGFSFINAVRVVVEILLCAPCVVLVPAFIFAHIEQVIQFNLEIVNLIHDASGFCQFVFGHDSVSGEGLGDNGKALVGKYPAGAKIGTLSNPKVSVTRYTHVIILARYHFIRLFGGESFKPEVSVIAVVKYGCGGSGEHLDFFLCGHVL